MKTAAFSCALVMFVTRTNAFVGSSTSARLITVRPASSLRMASDATVPGLIKKTRDLKLLSTAANLGLLSKLEKAGLTLKDVEKLLPLIDENDLIGFAKGLGPELLEAAPTALAAAPAALPIVASALSIPGEALFAVALASIAAGLALIVVLPHNSISGIALETFFVIPFLFVLPAVCAVGGLALSGLKKGWLIDTITSFKPALPNPVSLPPVGAPSVAIALERAPLVVPSFGGDSAKAEKRKPAATAKGKPAVAAKGRPVVTDMAKPAVEAVKAASKKIVQAAPKPVSKPKPTGNIKNIPKAL